MEWNSRFLIFAIYGNAKDEWNSAESKRSMAEDARENKKNDRGHCSGDDYPGGSRTSGPEFSMQFCHYVSQFWQLYRTCLKIYCNISICEIGCIGFMIVVLAFEFRISCMFPEKLPICCIHVIYGICQSKFIYFFQPFALFL